MNEQQFFVQLNEKIQKQHVKVIDKNAEKSVEGLQSFVQQTARTLESLPFGKLLAAAFDGSGEDNSVANNRRRTRHSLSPAEAAQLHLVRLQIRAMQVS